MYIAFHPDTLTEVQQRNLEAKFRKMSGTKNSGTIAVTSGNLGYINFGLSAVDLAIMDTLKMTLVDVCNVYHVPSQLFNSEIGKTYSNLKEARKQMYTDAVLPMADRIYGKLSRKLLPKYPYLNGRDVYFKVDQSNINELQPDSWGCLLKTECARPIRRHASSHRWTRDTRARRVR